ncbi:MAG: hypothetical protein HQP61_10655 [Peptococcaceae bacterium]|nr:hypothetical protein [Candidatus Syntrophopropionicum ammoniitolerans]
MNASDGKFNRVPKNRQDVEAYLAKLEYALQDKSILIEFQKERYVDENRPKEYTNVYTMAELFPDASLNDVLHRELASLRVQEYIETVKDARYPRRSEFWVFGKKYTGKDVYIKFRVEIIQRTYIFIMSFHFSEIPFSEVHFPFA